MPKYISNAAILDVIEIFMNLAHTSIGIYFNKWDPHNGVHGGGPN
jgi:hypothetical protein